MRVLTIAFSLSLLAAAAAGADEVAVAGWPEVLEVNSGDVSIRIIGKARWTMNRIAFKGREMTTHRSAYGTVFLFPELGFFGTGHLENEPEDVRELAFFLDGKRVDGKDGQLEGESFRMERRSRIKAFDIRCDVELGDDRLIETTTISAREATPLKLVYHFMHAWRPSATEYLAGNDGGEEEGGVFRDEEEAKGFLVNKEVDWVAVYDGPSETFAVSRLLEKPELGGATSMIWNVPGRYRKFYLKCFNNETVPKGFEGTWKMATGFGNAKAGEWKAKARALADAMNREK